MHRLGPARCRASAESEKAPTLSKDADLRPLGVRARLSLLLAVFAIAVGYGFLLPILPFTIERIAGIADVDVLSRHTSLLTGTYTLAIFLFAPSWGRAADRHGRRPVMFAGQAELDALAPCTGPRISGGGPCRGAFRSNQCRLGNHRGIGRGQPRDPVSHRDLLDLDRAALWRDSDAPCRLRADRRGRSRGLASSLGLPRLLAGARPDEPTARRIAAPARAIASAPRTEG